MLPQLLSTWLGTLARDYDRGLFEAGARAFSGWPQLLCVSPGVGRAFRFPAVVTVASPAVDRLRPNRAGCRCHCADRIGCAAGRPEGGGVCLQVNRGKDVVFYRVYQPSVACTVSRSSHEPAVPGQWVYVVPTTSPSSWHNPRHTANTSCSGQPPADADRHRRKTGRLIMVVEFPCTG